MLLTVTQLRKLEPPQLLTIIQEQSAEVILITCKIKRYGVVHLEQNYVSELLDHYTQLHQATRILCEKFKLTYGMELSMRAEP